MTEIRTFQLMQESKVRETKAAKDYTLESWIDNVDIPRGIHPPKPMEHICIIPLFKTILISPISVKFRRSPISAKFKFFA